MVSMINQVIISARTAPATLSARCAGMSLVSRFFSTTFDATRNIMYGLMVVPIFATKSEIYEGSVDICGMAVTRRASSQSGFARMPATTYVTKMQLMARRIFSIRRYDPPTVRIQTRRALMGTETYVGMPKRSILEAIPANSENVTAIFDIKSANIARVERRIPKRSRMREARPLPVTQPMRAEVSCTTMSKKHMIGTVQSCV